MRPEARRLAAIGTPILLLFLAAAWLGGPRASAPAPTGPPIATGQAASPRATAAASSVASSASAPSLVLPDSPTITAPGAVVTIVEFLDFECEACGAAFPIVKQVLDAYEGRVTYVVRDFPNHNNSVLAASAAFAAGEQGKYWEMYDLLFGRQTTWAERQESQAPAFLGFAQELGLDMTRFQADLESGRYVERIRRDFEAARILGVDATPTFFVDGEKIVGVVPFAEFKRRIDAALAARG